MSDEIELASDELVAVLRLEWETQQELRRTYAPEYVESNKLDLERIAENYKKSEEMRKAKLSAWADGRQARRKARLEANREKYKAKTSSLKVKKKSADDEKWNKAFEKHEDKDYYKLDPFTQKRG